jgi:hypothetical protein
MGQIDLHVSVVDPYASEGLYVLGKYARKAAKPTPGIKSPGFRNHRESFAVDFQWAFIASEQFTRRKGYLSLLPSALAHQRLSNIFRKPVPPEVHASGGITLIVCGVPAVPF